MNFKKLGCACLAALGMGAILWGGGRYLYTQEVISFLGKQLTPIAGAKVIPQNAIAVSYVDTDYERWSELKQLTLPNTKILLQDQVEDWQENFLNVSDVKYQQDIEPWLGGAMVAMLPHQQEQNNINLLIILGIKNKLKARDFFNKLQKDSNLKSSKTKYRGFKITKVVDDDNHQIISTLIENKLIIANEQEIIEQAINTYQNNSSLIGNSQTYLPLNQKLDSQESLAEVYISNYSQLIKNTINSDQELPEIPLLEQLALIKSTTISLTAVKQGIGIRLITKLDSEKTELELDTNQGKLLKYFPDETIALLNGQGINKIWSGLVKQLERDEENSRVLDIVRLFLRITANLDLDRDIFGWMDGEFAVGLIKTETPIIPDLNMGLGGVIILETTQSDIARQKLESLETNLAKQFNLKSIETQVNHKKMIQWQDINSEKILSYGWLDSHKLLFTFGDYAWRMIDPKQHQLLPNNKFFNTIKRELPNNNQGYLYLDVAQILNMAHYLPLEELDDETKKAIALLKSIKGIGSTTTMIDQYTNQQDLYILFQED